MSDVEITGKSYPKSKLASRVRNVHMLVFVLVLVLVTVMAVVIATGIASDASEKLARFYSIEAVGRFNIHVNQELALVREISRSAAVIDWFADEENPAKKTVAYNEIMNYTSILKSANVYFGINKSLNEYSVDNGITFANFVPFDKIDPADAYNDWYFNCVRSTHEYVFNIDVAKASDTPRLWINYKVMAGNNLLGVICSGLSFEETIDCLFSQYNSKDVMGYIIDKNGYIQMDSVPSDSYFDEKGRQKNNIRTICPDPVFVSAIGEYLMNINGYFDMSSQAEVIKLDKNYYMYVSIAPITDTDWSIVTFFNNHALYSIRRFFPLLFTMLSAFLIYTLVSSIFMHWLVFRPVNHLTNSLSASNFYIGEIFGCDRDDEIGILAQTIQRMRDRLSTYNAELLRAARERERLIRIDQLTDIPNRRNFDERLPLEWGRAIRTKTPISILILDLDHFKDYNDTYGHLQGDKALQVVAKVFSQELKRSSDLVARWGGEEFAILLANTDFSGAHDVAERIRQKTEDLQIVLANGSVSKITVSIGVNSLIPTTINVLEEFIHHADMALYAAKKEGRNRVCLYNGVQL
ncbi:MAG: GGDEF domain-containing protein [Treponema sp.]|nr:GGDEF domain-containing protein [Treponema sp.]